MRISKMTSRIGHKGLPLAGLIGLALGACGSLEETNELIENNLMSHGNWEQLQGAYSNRLEQVAVEHPVSFPADRAELDLAERRRLVSFLQSSSIGGSDEVSLVGPLRGDAQPADPLTAARTAYLKEELGAFGISLRSGANGGQHAGLSDNQMNIVVDRWIVITPDCGQSQPSFGTRPNLTPGCADTANFGLMIADPRDLAQGRPLGPADGERSARAVDEYRTGEREYEPEVYDTDVTSSTGEKL